MTLGSPVQLYRVCNETSQTGVWRHSYQTSSTVPAGWEMERALGRLYSTSDPSVTQLFQYSLDLQANGTTLTYYRLGTSATAPTGWTLVGSVGYIYTSQPIGTATVPLYQLSYDWGGSTLYFYTTSEFERDYAISNDNMTYIGAIGYLLPAALSMVISTSSSPGVATSTPSGKNAELKLGDCLEISLDAATFGASGSITQVKFFTQDPDTNPGQSPSYTFDQSSAIVDQTIGSSKYRMWYEGTKAVLIANNENSTLVGNRPPIWYQVFARDSQGTTWELDPELINDGGDPSGGPAWSG